MIEAEVAKLFDAYEDALVRGDVPALMDFFWPSADFIRFGVADEQYGISELLAFRLANPGVWAGRTPARTKIVVHGEDLAIVTTEFTYPGRPQLGRQSQTWRRIDGRWLIVHAHVSER